MSKNLKVLQIIDSLDIGGAERVCVNYANALSQVEGVDSFLCVARNSGPLFEMINKDVTTLILNKKSSLDLVAIKTLKAFIKKHGITHIHAHTSSFFIARIAQLFTDIKIVWHLHNGEMKSIDNKQLFVMKLFSRSFSQIITVNTELNEWAQQVFSLTEDKIVYIENYPDLNFSNKEVLLAGNKNKRIVSLANLRYQKDHMNLLMAFENLIKIGYTDWNLFLVGNDYQDEYSINLKAYIKKFKLGKNVHILGARSDVADILKSCSLGVVSSKVEGLPVSLLEYGLASLAVVSTNVGECAKVLDSGKVGVLVEKENAMALSKGLELLMKDSDILDKYTKKYENFIKAHYSKDSIIKKIIKIYEAA